MAFQQTLKAKHAALIAEFEDLAKRRAEIDRRMDLVRKGIDGLQDAMEVLGEGTVEAKAGAYEMMQRAAGPTVADKIRFIISHEAAPLTAREIISHLGSLGFKFEGDRPMATVHSICHRLATAKHPVVEEVPKSTPKAWRWVGNK